MVAFVGFPIAEGLGTEKTVVNNFEMYGLEVVAEVFDVGKGFGAVGMGTDVLSS